MPPKRPGEGDASGLGNQNGASAKKPRTSGPEPAASPGPSSIQAQIEAAKAKAAALAASLSKSRSGAIGLSTAGRPPPPSPLQTKISAAKAPGLDVAAMQRQIAEAKKRADQIASGTLAKLQQQRTDKVKPGEIHPLLMGSSSLSASGSRGPKFSSVGANARNTPLATSFGVKVEEKVNPYLSIEGNDEENKVKGRNMHRNLQFHKPGRHVREAEEARREAQMEALKKRIQESAKKAGMEELSAEERALRRNPPPEVEWWDQALLPDKTYKSIEVVFGKGKAKERELGLLIEGEGSPIDIYIQHPIPIPAPSDKIKVEAKGVMLTKKEMKKMRRQRRLADQEDKRDKIKMGLLPPDPPKVKLSNLMRVLTSEAVADPTKVEARVRREVAARKDIHEKQNLENQLTPEQRKAKLEEQKEKDASKGIYTLVFKIRHLVSPSHKFKVRKNALQFGLTGLAIFEKNFALVVVEGGHKSIKAYRRLMTVRIDWTDPGRPKADDTLGDLLDLDPGTSSTNNGKDISKDQEEIGKIDWNENYCKIIFEGPVRESHFRFGFKAHYCDHESGAKEALGPKLASFWDLAKKFDSAHEE